MDNHFQPSRQRAAELRLSMASSLYSSLAARLQELGSAGSQASGSSMSPDHIRASASDFTAYFDLLALTEVSSAVPDTQAASVVARAQSCLERLAGTSASSRPPRIRPRVSTLGAPYFTQEENSALVRWWDTEPENAMCLLPLDAAEWQAAQVLVANALDILQRAAPELYDELVMVLDDIVLARAGDGRRLNFNGVSSFAAWGAIGINQPAHAHWAEVLKTAVHECGHLVLFALAREEPLVLNDPAERLGSPLREDLRPIDGIYHAAFVSAREALALDACLNWLETEAPQQAADAAIIEQLLEDSVLAFWDCCAQLKQYGRLTPLGAAILEDALAYMQEAFEVQPGA